jgi:hypothetical protein
MSAKIIVRRQILLLGILLGLILAGLGMYLPSAFPFIQHVVGSLFSLVDLSNVLIFGCEKIVYPSGEVLWIHYCTPMKDLLSNTYMSMLYVGIWIAIGVILVNIIYSIYAVLIESRKRKPH